MPTRLSVRVIPNAARDEIIGWADNVLKVKLKAVPEDGKANRALKELLGRQIGCRGRAIRILSGEKSRSKILELPIDGEAKEIFHS
jgi:uncharacterized protein (TIGR00251 family)